MSKMAVRTLLKLGKSSLVVVLPKDWLKEVGLKSGDKVLIRQEDDGSIRIIPANISLANTSRKARIVINVEKCNDKTLIQRILVANYLVGNDNIALATKRENLSPDLIRNIREVISKLRGFEIIEQRPNQIILQCMMDATKFSMENLVGRMLALILSMTDYIKKTFKDSNKDYLKEILFLENELDRIYWFGVRQLLLVQKNRALAKFVGIESALHILGNRTILKVLELAGDYLEEIAKDLSQLDWSELDNCEEFREEFMSLLDKIEDMIGDTLRAFNGLDVFLANDILNTINAIKERILGLNERILERVKNVKSGSILIKVLTRLLDMAKSVGVVCEIVINRSMENLKRIMKSCIYKEF